MTVDAGPQIVETVFVNHAFPQGRPRGEERDFLSEGSVPQSASCLAPRALTPGLPQE